MRHARALIVVLIAGVGSPSCGHRSLEEQCPEGFSGQDAIDAVPSTHTGTFMTTGKTAYTLKVQYRGGSIECVRAETHQGCAGPTLIPAHVNVEVTVTFRTDDGLFTEMQMAGVLTLEKKGSAKLEATG